MIVRVDGAMVEVVGGNEVEDCIIPSQSEVKRMRDVVEPGLVGKV